MILFKALTGSRLHGLYNEKSDYDWKSVEVSPLRHIISPFRKLKGKDSVSPEEDNCTYEFVHFAKLLAQSNPTILEVLWSKKFEYPTHLSPYVTELREGRKKLLDKDRIFYAHRGYASNQRNKMSLDQPNEHVKAKAIVAYIRIMKQGIELLERGDFDPVLPEGSIKEMLLDIKYKFDKNYHLIVVEEYIKLLEERIEKTYKECKLEFKPDLPWIEYMIEKIYTELGQDESLPYSEKRQQISRCLD
jgi:uncharacterized protein